MVEAPQDRTIQIGKIRARYWDEGSQGEPVVLIHGLGGYVENWLPSFDALAAQHRVVAVDLPGHGRTEKPTDVAYGVENLAGFVKDFMAALQIKRAHVVGHSVGGAVATRLVLMHPATMDRLALVAPAGFGKEFHPMVRLSTAPILGELLTRPSRSGSADFARTAVHDPAVITDELIELDYQMALQPGAQAASLRTLRGLCSPFGQKKSLYGVHVSRLASITNPVLVIWGRQDRVIPAAHAEVAAKGLPNVRVQLLDNCGHMPMLEQADAFNASLLEFLDR